MGAGGSTSSPDVVIISPRSSPQHEAVIQYPLASTSGDVPIFDANKEAGGERHEHECQEIAPLVVPPLTTIPESNSPTRISIDEPIRTGNVPASEAAGNQAMTIGKCSLSTDPNR